MAGIYMHIPFCKQACTYCNFHFSTSLKMKDQLLQAMHYELVLQKNYLQGQTIETIYLGGGTPSLLTADEIKKLTQTIYDHYPVSVQEFTLEANPDDLTLAYLKELRQTEITRFSIGVQSFRETDLRYMNRAHTAKQADYAIKAAQDAGFSDLTIDLIYGTPGLSDVDWKYNLSQIAALRIPHFSAYALTVEEGTALHQHIKMKKAAPVSNNQSAHQFELLMEFAATSGYEHYEISNLALPGRYAVHNTNYWRGRPYLGIGPSAHSFDGKSRRWNISNNALYTQNLLKDHKLLFEEEVLTPAQGLNEYIMTSLRTMWGTDLKKIAGQWGSDTAQTIRTESMPFIEKNQVVLTDEHLVLTDKGKLIADRIASELFIIEN